MSKKEMSLCLRRRFNFTSNIKDFSPSHVATVFVKENLVQYLIQIDDMLKYKDLVLWKNTKLSDSKSILIEYRPIELAATHGYALNFR